MQDFSLRAWRGCANFFTSGAVRIGRLVRSIFSFLTPSQKIQLAVEQTLAQLRGSVVCFEGLEDRQLFAGISLSGSVLTITGNSTGKNTLGANYNSAGQLVAQFNSTTKTYSASSVSSVNIVGGSSGDYLYLTSATTKPGTFHAGGGNDTVWAGNGNDTIYGEAGDDTLNGRGGNDVIYGGDGNDSIDGGTGTNSINAGNPSTTTTPTPAPTGSTSSGTTDPTKPYPPVSPTNLAASSASSTSIKLTWSDNTNRELGYKIERSTDGSTWSQIATTGASIATYTNTGLTSGKKYYYRVRAYNEYGNSSYTNTASATTGSSTNTGGSTGGTTSGGTIIPHDANASSPNAVISMLAGSANAGIPITVNAMSSSLGSGTPLTARYEWNFGDSNGKYNTLVGFNAAHIYDNAGTYTITLKIINESGKVDTATRSVTIASANRKTIYVSAAGNDNNSGTSTSSPVKTMARADAILGDNSNYEVLFRRGDTFTTTTGINFGGDNVVIGAYGTGSMPVLKYNGPSSYNAIIWARGGCTGVTVQDITFDSVFTGSDSSNIPNALAASGTNFAARNCQFLNVGYAFNGNMYTHGLLLQDNDAPSITGIKSYFGWIEGDDLCLIGNKVANSTREHIVRAEDVNHVLLAYNNFTNLNRTSVDQYDSNKGCMTIHKGNYVWIANNTINDGPLSVGPLGETNGLNDTGARMNYTVVENNKINAQTLVLHGAQHVMFRNNISTMDGDVAYCIDGYNSQYGRGVVDLNLYNNTATESQAEGNFIKVQGDVNGINLVNNLYVAPNEQTGANRAAPVYVNDTSLSSFRVVTNNVWSIGSILAYAQGGINYIWPSWSSSAGYQTPTEWNAISQVGTDVFSKVTLSGYTPSSVAANEGTWTPGVFYDYYGKLRPTTGIAAGAVEA